MDRFDRIALLTLCLAATPAFAQEAMDEGMTPGWEDDSAGNWDGYRSRMRERWRERFGAEGEGANWDRGFGGGRGGPRGGPGGPGGGGGGGGPFAGSGMDDEGMNSMDGPGPDEGAGQGRRRWRGRQGGFDRGGPSRFGGGGPGGPGGFGPGGPGGGPGGAFGDRAREHMRRMRAGGRGGKGGRGGPGMGQIYERIRELDEGLADELKGLHDKDPQQFRQHFMRAAGSLVRQATKLRQRAQEASEAERTLMKKVAVGELRSVVAAYKLKQGVEGATKAQLEKTLGEVFDAKLEMQNAQAKTMEAKLSDLKKRLAERQKHRGEIIKNRLGELTGEQPRYRW